MAGDTPSNDFPTTAGAYDTAKGSSDDMFALQLDLTQTGSAQLAYSTFIGGVGIDRATGVAVDGSGRAHVAGWTQSSGLATAGAHDTSLGGTSDGVLAILAADGTTMEELTYVGGIGGDSTADLALTASSIWLTGYTQSGDFPTTAGAHDSSLGGTQDAFLMRFSAQAIQDPVVLDTVYHGTVVLPDGSSSVTDSIGASIDNSKAILTFGTESAGNAPADTEIMGVYSGPGTLGFSRVGTSGDVTIHWSVAKFSSGVNVQRGSILMNGVGQVNLSLTAVDTSKAFVITSHKVGGTDFDGSSFLSTKILDPTTLRLAFQDNRNDQSVMWQVVEYSEASVQFGTSSLASGDMSQTATIGAVDPAKSWLTYSYTTTAGTVSNIGQKLVSGVVADSTTVAFQRQAAGNTVDISWSLIEFTDSAEVQHSALTLTTEPSVAVPISPVDPRRAFAVGGYRNSTGASPYTADDVPGVARFTAELATPGELTLTRGSTASGARAGWFVIEWPEANLAPTATDDPPAGSYQVAEGAYGQWDVMGNDSDPNFDVLYLDSFTQPAIGTVTRIDGGTPADTSDDFLRFDAPIGTSGPASFTYTISDGILTDTATVSVNVPATAAYAISGTVFEDIAGDVLNDGTIGGANNPGVQDTDVHLYRDTDGDGIAEVTDTYLTTVPTDANGDYSFPGLSSGKYFVVVDSKTVRSTAPAISSNDVWPEQTYGPGVSECADGAGGTVNDPTPGPCYGGRRAGVSDNLTTWYTGAEHLAKISIASADKANIDFGFSFNVVTTTAGGDARDDDPVTNLRSVQGSLRQFITNANTITGANVMRFVPAEPANATDGTNDWWRIPVTDLLPTVTDDDTTIDGRAFDFTDGSTVLDTNAAQIGAGVAVGTEGTYTTPTLDPELEIWNNRGTAVVATGLVFEATDSVLRHVSIWGFGDSAGTFDTNVRFGTNYGVDPDFTGSLVEFNVIGTGPASFADPAVGNRSGQKNLTMRETDNAIVRDNLIGFAGGVGVDFNTGSNTGTVLRNEIRRNGLLNPSANPVGVWISGNVTGNLIADNASGVFNGPTLFITYGDNTITANGWGGTRPHGIEVIGAPTTIRRNVIADNAGSGVVVEYTDSNILITQNSIHGNGTVLGSIGIDLLASGDDDLSAPFVTLNDDGDGDTGGNNLLNYPVIDTARIEGSDLTVKGWSRPGTTIELYLAAPDPSGFGEGQTWLISKVEGSADDTDATTATYGPGAVNGIAQGTDTTSRFSFNIPIASLAAPVVGGDSLTSLATSGTDTSEFGGNVTVPAPFVVNSTGDASDANAGNGVCETAQPRAKPARCAPQFKRRTRCRGPTPSTSVSRPVTRATRHPQWLSPSGRRLCSLRSAHRWCSTPALSLNTQRRAGRSSKSTDPTSRPARRTAST